MTSSPEDATAGGQDQDLAPCRMREDTVEAAISAGERQNSTNVEIFLDQMVGPAGAPVPHP